MEPASTERVQATYNTVADSYSRLVGDASFEADIDLAMVQHFVSHVGFHRNAELLDAGCGAGRMMTHLSQLDPSLRIAGIDLAQGMVELARAKHPNRRIEQADLAALPFAEASFDGVLCWYSIIHTPERKLSGMVSELRRVLRAGGAVLLAFHLGTGERIARGAYGHDVELSVQLHDVHRASQILTDGGFTLQTALERAARPNEKDPQGFLLATRG